MNDEPQHFFWADLETTGLSPKDDHILEVAFVVTDFRYPYREITRGHYLVSGPGRVELLADRCPDEIQRMHASSGLTEALRVAEETMTIPSIEQELLGVSFRWSEEKNTRPRLAGFSVAGFDLPFLRQHMPAFARRLSHQCFDTTSVKLAARSLGMDTSEDRTTSAHRAMADVEASIREMKRSVEWLAEMGNARILEQHPCSGAV